MPFKSGSEALQEIDSLESKLKLVKSVKVLLTGNISTICDTEVVDFKFEKPITLENVKIIMKKLKNY